MPRDQMSAVTYTETCGRRMLAQGRERRRDGHQQPPAPTGAEGVPGQVVTMIVSCAKWSAQVH